MTRETIYVDKPYEKWTLEEKLKGAVAVFNYLKFDGIKDPLDEDKRTFTDKHGRKVQHIQEYITSESNDMIYGFFDEIVFVLGSYSQDKTTSELVYEGKHFLGMHWNQSVDARIDLLNNLNVDDIRKALFATMMHSATRKNATI